MARRGLAETPNTTDLLKANGIELVHDWMIDDLPFWICTKTDPWSVCAMR